MDDNAICTCGRQGDYACYVVGKGPGHLRPPDQSVHDQSDVYQHLQSWSRWAGTKCPSLRIRKADHLESLHSNVLTLTQENNAGSRLYSFSAFARYPLLLSNP